MAHLQDQLRRPLQDLRLSVTDRCNYRCPHCLPAGHFPATHEFLPRSRILRFEEVTRVTRLLAELGVRRLRLTGGEPLLRRGLPQLVAMLRELPGIEEIALTTNGTLLEGQAPRLAAAGVDRVTVSLDSLDPATYETMSGGRGQVAAALAGIEAARQAGLTPVKVNAVIRRGVNEPAVLDLVRHFHGTGVIVRFIEYMDVGTLNSWERHHVVTASEIQALLATEFQLQPLEPAREGEVARRFRLQDGGGEVGIIGSVSAPFCRTCSRLRLSCEGTLYTCLYAPGGADLRTPLRTGASDDSLRRIITAVWERRVDRYSELRGEGQDRGPRPEMYHLGG